MPFGDLCEYVLSQNHSFFSFGDFFHPQNMCLFHVLGLCFDGVTDSSLFLISRCFVFGCLEHNLLSVQLVTCACIVWMSCLLSWSFSFFWCFFCFSGVVLCWVLVCFLSMLVVILGLSFLDCSVLMLLLLFMSWLLVCVCVCFLGLPFQGKHHGKSYGYGQPGGVNKFFRVFS